MFPVMYFVVESNEIIAVLAQAQVHMASKAF
jgi:hypothetical protein